MSSDGDRSKQRIRSKRSSFAARFALLVNEFGSRYRLAKAAGVAESTLQQYADQQLPPRSDILIKLAHAANVSIEWLATGQGEMRAAGQLPGATFADVVMVELRDIHAALQREEIRGFLPLSRWWLEHRLGIRDPEQLMLIEADQDLPPEIRKMDLLLVDRSQATRRRATGVSHFRSSGTCREAGRRWFQAGNRSYRVGNLERARNEGDRSFACWLSDFSRGEECNGIHPQARTRSSSPYSSLFAGRSRADSLAYESFHRNT
jgi:transcriptional regulator with XRE-family HTH domain